MFRWIKKKINKRKGLRRFRKECPGPRLLMPCTGCYNYIPGAKEGRIKDREGKCKLAIECGLEEE